LDKLVGPEGRVVACDISEEMLKFAKENAVNSGLNNIQTLRSAAEELDQTDEKFDAAICRTGLMLFGSPQSALTAVWGTLSPGARCSVMVFSTPQNNPFIAQTMAIALQHAGKKPPAPGSPGLFALASQDILQDLFHKCGFDNVETEVVRVPLNLPSVADAVTMMQEAFGAFRAVLADLDESGRARAWTEIGICLQRFEAQSGLSTELEMLITSGEKST
jgi:SAM-dependent methyltransferase